MVELLRRRRAHHADHVAEHQPRLKQVGAEAAAAIGNEGVAFTQKSQSLVQRFFPRYHPAWPRTFEVTVTALLPGPTETDFFDRAGMGADTEIGTSEKDDPADVAKTGFAALMRGDGQVVHGLKNKMQVAAAKINPDDRLAESHRKKSEPGSAEK